jgi:chromosome segregation ATPase
MIRKVIGAIGGLVVLLAGLFWVSRAGLGELGGYFRATADTTVEGLTDQVPKEIRDRKMENDLRQARQQLIDRQVALNVSRSQIDTLRADVQRLEASVARRERLLVEAYPVWKQAVDEEKSTVFFASTDFSVPDFQAEIDKLMTEQDRETRQLAAKREGLQRLEKSLQDGERALADMRLALEGIEQEVALLKSRREQADIEASTLDMISTVTAHHQNTATSVGSGVDRLKTEVEQLEARNEARRTLAPVAVGNENRLTRAWTRLESLKAYYDEHAAGQAAETAQAPAANDQALLSDAADARQPAAAVDAAEVVITIRPEQAGNRAPAKKPREKREPAELNQ